MEMSFSGRCGKGEFGDSEGSMRGGGGGGVLVPRGPGCVLSSNPSPCGGSVCLLGMEQVGKDPLLSRPPALRTM